MIVRPIDDRLRLVTQPDHAHLAGGILAVWRADGLPSSPRRREIVFAAREHDNGWREADSAPRVESATGRPHDFLTLPDAERRAIWRRGVRRHRGERPWATLLVTLHALALHRGRRGEGEEWDRFLDELEVLRDELLEERSEPAGAAERDYGLLALADLLALAAARCRTEPFDFAGYRGGVAATPAGDEVRLAPFPLAGATTFRLACREVPDRPYRGDADLAVTLAATRWREVAVRLVPGSDEAAG